MLAESRSSCFELAVHERRERHLSRDGFVRKFRSGGGIGHTARIFGVRHVVPGPITGDTGRMTPGPITPGPMRAMRVLRLVTHARTREPVLLLGEADGDRCLPVFLRRPQAEVIAAGPRDEEGTPLTQDLLLPLAARLGQRV